MFLLRGMNEAGDPVDVAVDPCWRCGVLVLLSMTSMEEHVDRAHPVAADPPRHARDAADI